jgi:ATP-dependent Clp protease ATP-binding subunit ClpC
MFERYTEKAGRVVFFARYEAIQYGSPYIETEHLLLGLLREDRALAKRFLGEVNAEEEIRSEIARHITSSRTHLDFRGSASDIGIQEGPEPGR